MPSAAHERRVVALTGATGFVGRVLTRFFLDAGHQVVALVRSTPSDLRHDRLNLVRGDLENQGALQALCQNAEIVIHVAGAIAARTESDFVRINAIGTRNLANAMEKCPLRPRLLHVSSLAARNPTLSAYARSKHLAEQVVRGSDLEWIILRPPAIYGPSDPALAPLWKMLARGWLLQAGPDTARFSLLHVDDLSRAIMALAKTPAWPAGQVLSPDDGRPQGYSWADVGNIAASVGGRRVVRLKISKRLLQVFAMANLSASKILGHTPMLSPGKVRELTHPDWVCGDNGACSIPDWRPQLNLDRALVQLPGWNSA